MKLQLGGSYVGLRDDNCSGSRCHQGNNGCHIDSIRIVRRSLSDKHSDVVEVSF
jgi:hypothetical protein